MNPEPRSQFCDTSKRTPRSDVDVKSVCFFGGGEWVRWIIPARSRGSSATWRGPIKLRRDDAVRELWERFFADLTTYARRRLRAMNAPVGPADEEDAAARAFSKVCRGIERGQLKLANRVDLTRVLRSATTREVFTLLARAGAAGSRLGRRGDPGAGPRPGAAAGPAPAGLRRLPAAPGPAGDRRAAAGGRVEAGRPHQRGDRGQARPLRGHGRAHPGADPRDVAAEVGRRRAPRVGEIRARDAARRKPPSERRPRDPAAPATLGHEDEARLLRELAGLP